MTRSRLVALIAGVSAAALAGCGVPRTAGTLADWTYDREVRQKMAQQRYDACLEEYWRFPTRCADLRPGAQPHPAPPPRLP